MKRVVPSSITVEEAVAEMVNMDYIPAGFTLLDMIAAFQEEAEVEYENARTDRLPEDKLTPLKTRMDSCRARHTLAHLLLESLRYEVNNPTDSMIVLADDSSSHQRLTFDSVSDWASEKYGIGISRMNDVSNTVDEHLKNVSWENVTIKIWQDYYIKYSFNRKTKKSHFRDIGLMGKKIKDKPNDQAEILIVLGLNKKYPNEKQNTAATHKLRRVLRKWIGLPGDPFMPYNKDEGWKPRFTVKFLSENYADYFPERKPSHVSFDDSTYSSDSTYDDAEDVEG